MGRKGGRPEKAIKKEIRACIRYSRVEYFVLREKSAKAGLRVSEYIRQITLNGIVKNRLTEEERQFVRQLIGMANNLNQLVRACHQEGLLQAMVYFEKYRNHLDDILKKLRA